MIAPALTTATASADASGNASETVSLYNNGTRRFTYVHEPPPRMRITALGPKSKNDAVPIAVWEHWQKALSADQLADIMPGGNVPLPVPEIIKAKDAELDAKQAKLDAALKQVENLSGILAKLQLDQAQAPRAVAAGRR